MKPLANNLNKFAWLEIWYLLCASQRENISSADSIGTGCDDAGQFGILGLICKKQTKHQILRLKSIICTNFFIISVGKLLLAKNRINIFASALVLPLCDPYEEWTVWAGVAEKLSRLWPL